MKSPLISGADFKAGCAIYMDGTICLTGKFSSTGGTSDFVLAGTTESSVCIGTAMPSFAGAGNFLGIAVNGENKYIPLHTEPIGGTFYASRESPAWQCPHCGNTHPKERETCYGGCGAPKPLELW